jgi:hypothetical protein
MKICTKCLLEKPLAEFYADKKGKNGLSYYCKDCAKLNSIKRRLEKPEECKAACKKHYDEHKEEARISSAEWRKTHKEEKRIRDKKYKDEHKEELKIKRQLYRAEHLEVCLANEAKRRRDHPERSWDYYKKRREADALFKLKCNLRGLIYSSIVTRGGYSKDTHTHEILGCSFEEFMVHIETQFVDGMTWDNYSEWEYDHIYPLSLALDRDHLIQLNHYTNFQPLWAEDNRKKGNKLPEDLK